MAYKIKLSDEALSQLENRLDYLVENWFEKIAKEFINKVDTKLSFISELPYSYSASPIRKDIRKCVVTKQVSIFYKILYEQVRIIAIFDTRQSRDKIKL